MLLFGIGNLDLPVLEKSSAEENMTLHVPLCELNGLEVAPFCSALCFIFLFVFAVAVRGRSRGPHQLFETMVG